MPVRINDGSAWGDSAGGGGGGGGSVDSVNSQTGVVVLDAADVGADPSGSAATAQATAVQRANHTGSQAASTISDFAEAVSDQVGTMVTSNTETGITVTYQDADNTLDFTVNYGTSGSTACVGNDSRLSDDRDPTLHASSHASGATDPITPDSVGALTVVRWSGTDWPARPAGATWGVLFLSTNDEDATAPSDINLATGDIWQRHPDAV